MTNLRWLDYFWLNETKEIPVEALKNLKHPPEHPKGMNRPIVHQTQLTDNNTWLFSDDGEPLYSMAHPTPLPTFSGPGMNLWRHDLYALPISEEALEDVWIEVPDPT